MGDACSIHEGKNEKHEKCFFENSNVSSGSINNKEFLDHLSYL
jgi:hypothetical protein